MHRIIFFALFLLNQPLHAFVLVSDRYRLASPEDTTVNIAAGGCQGNGISNDSLKASIQTAIDDYWNTVTESYLKLKVGDEVNRTTAEPGEILVSCGPLTGAAGVAHPNPDRGAAEVVLNSTIFVPGNYVTGAVEFVLIHELGHAIGLAHSADPASVMTYESNDWSPHPRHLSQDDKDGVVYLYPNKSQAMFLGACSAIADSGQSVPTASWYGFLIELCLMLSVGQLLNFGFAGGRRLIASIKA